MIPEFKPISYKKGLESSSSTRKKKIKSSDEIALEEITLANHVKAILDGLPRRTKEEER